MAIVSFLGQIIGFLIFIGIIYLIVQSIKLHPEQFELMEGEEILKNVKGNYVETILCKDSITPGEYAFTNKRIIFRSNVQWFGGTNIAVFYNEIVSIEKSMVRMILPVAFTVTTASGEKHKFSVMKRDIYIDLINSIIQKGKEENQG